jgi:hypothetical protein
MQTAPEGVKRGEVPKGIVAMVVKGRRACLEKRQLLNPRETKERSFK